MVYEFIITEEIQDLIDTALTQEDKEKTYPELVSKFVRQRYYERDVEAILNNYLDDPSSEKYNNDFRKLQEYRKACKLYAKQLLEMN